jgi:hypothetical protein
VQNTVEALRECKLLLVGKGLVAEHKDGVLVHPGTDLVQRLAIIDAPEIDRAHLGNERRMQLAEGQGHIQPPRARFLWSMSCNPTTVPAARGCPGCPPFTSRACSGSSP